MASKLMGYATPDDIPSGVKAYIPMPIELVRHLAIAKPEDVSYRQIIDAAIQGSRSWMAPNALSHHPTH